MRHSETVQQEFTRQAESFRASPTLASAELTTRVADALGDGVERVLDVACGPGVLLPALAERCAHVVGADLTHRNLILASEAKVAAPLHLVRSVAERLPFRDGGFDAAVLRLALHHFVDPAVVLSALRPLLRPGGRLVVLDVLGPEDPATAELRDALERQRDPSHTSLLSRTAMRRLLEEAGFALRDETLWSQSREFSEWARIINEPRRMADLEVVLRALHTSGDPTGLSLRVEAGELWFTYDWGLFVAETG